MKIIVRQVDADVEHDTLIELQKQVMAHDEIVKPEDPLQWWIAYDGETPVGYAALSPSLQRPDRGYLSAAGVHLSYRGLGLQKRLIRARVAYARKIGLLMLVTDTIPWNPASNNSLIACGFRSFSPTYTWKHAGACYWRKFLT